MARISRFKVLNFLRHFILIILKVESLPDDSLVSAFYECIFEKVIEKGKALGDTKEYRAHACHIGK